MVKSACAKASANTRLWHQLSTLLCFYLTTRSLSVTDEVPNMSAWIPSMDACHGRHCCHRRCSCRRRHWEVLRLPAKAQGEQHLPRPLIGSTTNNRPSTRQTSRACSCMMKAAQHERLGRAACSNHLSACGGALAWDRPRVNTLPLCTRQPAAVRTGDLLRNQYRRRPCHALGRLLGALGWSFVRLSLVSCCRGALARLVGLCSA